MPHGETDQSGATSQDQVAASFRDSEEGVGGNMLHDINVDKPRESWPTEWVSTVELISSCWRVAGAERPTAAVVADFLAMTVDVLPAVLMESETERDSTHRLHF